MLDAATRHALEELVRALEQPAAIDPRMAQHITTLATELLDSADTIQQTPDRLPNAGHGPDAAPDETTHS